MLSAAIAACAVACASFDYAYHRFCRRKHRTEQFTMDHGDRVALCRKILRHIDSAEDLLNHWSPRRDRRGVEWLVARLLFGHDSPDALRETPEFQECVHEMSSLHQHVDNAACGDSVFTPPFMTIRPVGYASSVFCIAQKAVRSRATVLMRRAGFVEMRHGDVRYWRSGSTAENKPLAVFIHGIGVGVYPYIPLLQDLTELFEIIAIEFDHLTLSGRESLTNLQAAETVEGILRDRSAVFVGHSYGTVIAATVNKRRPDLVSGFVLMAPACFLLYRGEIQSRFFDPRAPMSQRVLGRSPTIHAAIHSGTVWPQGEMWPEDMRDKRWLVALAEGDQLIPFDRTKKHIETHFDLEPCVRELVTVAGKHGSCLASQRKTVVEHVRGVFGSE